MIHGIAGSIGSGKSHLQLKIALESAEFKEKQLVCNFPLNRHGLKEYAKYKKYNWILKLLKHGGISEIHAPKKLEELLLPESIVCLDEAGIFLNSREFQKTSKQLLADLCQSRKFGTDLVWCSQFLEQVDSQFRMLTQYWTQANSFTIYDRKMRRPKLWYKRYYWMDSQTYYSWNTSAKAKMNHFRTRFAYSFRYEGGFLNTADKLLFDCFDSFTRLDAINSTAKIETMYTRPIHRPQTKWVSEFGLPSPTSLKIVPDYSRVLDYEHSYPEKFPDKSFELLPYTQETTDLEDQELIKNLFTHNHITIDKDKTLLIDPSILYKPA